MDVRARGGGGRASTLPPICRGSRRSTRDASPALIRCGWGLERNRNGGSAAAAILALPAVGGKFGVRGGGYTLSNSGVLGHHEDVDRRGRGGRTRLVNMNHLGRMLTEAVDPPVKVLFVYNCNPLATVPNQNLVRRGLEREDLTTIVFDQVLTDTARYADIVLPATTFLEQYDFARAYGPISLQMVRPASTRSARRGPNVDVFAEIEARLGPRPAGRAARRAGDDAGRAWTACRTGPATRSGKGARPAPPFGDAPVQFVDVFPRTPDGKVAPVPGGAGSRGALGLYALPARSGARRTTRSR